MFCLANLQVQAQKDDISSKWVADCWNFHPPSYDDKISWGKEEDNGASIYLKDPDTGIVYTDAAGNPIQQQTTGVQFIENLTVGITYKFGQKTK